LAAAISSGISISDMMVLANDPELLKVLLQ
jgi:hypothetical protein